MNNDNDLLKNQFVTETLNPVIVEYNTIPWQWGDKLDASTSVRNLPDVSVSWSGFSNTLVFTADDYNTVSWTSWNINLADWITSYSISGGNTGNMTSTTYLYIDKDVSLTTIQLTTTASASVGKTKILIWVASPNADSTKKAIFQAFWTNQVSTFITAGQIRADTITGNEIASNTITTGEINFWFASSSAKWGKINTWFTSSDLSTETAPSTWVKIDNTWIKMYSWWTEKVSIWADWNATFQWTITASTMTWWTVQTASSWARIELTSTNWLRSFDSGNNVRLRMPTDWTWITFFTSSWVSTNRLQWWVIWTWAWAWKRVLNIDNNWVTGDWNLLVDNDCWIIGTLWAAWKMRLPVWTNLY